MKNLIWLFLCIFMVGCISFTNPSPSIVVPDEPSFDGNNQNSGVLYQISTGGFIITQSAKDRYDALVKIYGKKFTPELIETTGVTSVYIITDEVYENFAKMIIWQKNPEVLQDIPMTEKKTSWWKFWKK